MAVSYGVYYSNMTGKYITNILKKCCRNKVVQQYPAGKRRKATAQTVAALTSQCNKIM